MKRTMWLACLLTLWLATPARPQPVFNTTCQGWGTSVLSFTTGTCSATGSNRLALMCGAFGNVSAALEQDTDASYGASTATLVNRQPPTVEGGSGAVLYQVLGAAVTTGSQTATITFNGFVRGAIGVMTFTNVHQTTPLGSPAANQGVGTSASISVSSAANELVADCLLMGDPLSVTAGAGQTPPKWTQTTDTGGGLDYLGGGSTKVGIASTVMSWSQANPHDWALIGVSIKPVAAAAAARRKGVYGYP
jgi:hypothetical protein